MSRASYVQARADHVASLASAAPLSAIEELVWNALDAENKISLYVRYTDLETGAVESRMVNKNK